MTVESLVRAYLPSINIMQLATVVDKKPYLCTVHYYSDEDLNFYWCSLSSRRHSEEISQNSSVAAYIMVHENTPEEDYVTGITILGTAKLLEEGQIDRKIVEAYANKHNDSDEFVEKVVKGESPFRLYRLKPNKIILFDNKNFPDNPRQEWNLT